MTQYSESYYTQNNYASYLEREDRYKRLAEDLHYDLFRKINFDKELSGKSILDFGCAVGFLVKALTNLGYDTYGYDISKWATDYAVNVVKNKDDRIVTDFNDLRRPNFYKLMIALDVFEHLEEYELADVLDNVNCEYMLIRIPVTRVTWGKYILQVSENDPTHHIRWTKDDWDGFFEGHGFTQMFTLNLGSIYDTDGVFCAMYKKHE
jgi:2-polyprenyl-3-methyl-5-hydroxy-6-metoxy-1,4-benzoquinol methylase